MSEIDCNKCLWFNNCQSDCVGYEPKHKHTNEEWLRSASTLEELAERVFNCAMANSWAMNEHQFKGAILSWLKGKHNGV